jgi:hypothetical protein
MAAEAAACPCRADGRLACLQRGLFKGRRPPTYAPWLLYAGCAVAFVIYDTLLSRLVEVYVGRKIKK